MSGPRFRRYVALGDSHTEGVGDGDDRIGVRGWADRLADHLAGVEPELTYANLAVRGRLAGQVRAEQLEAALALRPDLATVLAGVNDLLRTEFDADAVGAHLDAMFTALIAQGATVVTFTVPDITRIIPAARPLQGRIIALNQHIRAAARHGVIVSDIASHGVVTDPRLWSTDRLHCSPLGHERIAAALAEALNVPGVDSSWNEPLRPPLPRRGALAVIGGELRWATAFLAPWLGRRITGRSSGDGRTAKRPQLQPVRPTGADPEAAPAPTIRTRT